MNVGEENLHSMMNNIVLIGEFTEDEKINILSHFPPNSQLIECIVFVSDLNTMMQQIDDCIKGYHPIGIAIKTDNGEIELLRRKENESKTNIKFLN